MSVSNEHGQAMLIANFFNASSSPVGHVIASFEKVEDGFRMVANAAGECIQNSDKSRFEIGTRKAKTGKPQDHIELERQSGLNRFHVVA